MTIGLGEFLALGVLLFGIGGAGFLTRRNLLIQLMSIELMLNAANLVLVAFNRWRPDGGNQIGQVFALFVIAVAAAEVAVGLSIVIAFFRLRQTVETDRADVLRH